MSAIGGIMNLKGKEIDFSQLNKMRLLMSMRGRRESTCYFGGNVGIVCNASTPDLLRYRHGKQPAIFERGGHTYVIVSDGESLPSQAIFEKYRMEGIDFLGSMNGGFAVALYDGERKMLLLARDKNGKKPLYYKVRNGKAVFSSEARGISGAFGEALAVSREALSLHISAPVGVYRGANIFCEINEVLPGECVLFTEIGMSRFRYRDKLPETYREERQRQEKIDAPVRIYPVSDEEAIKDTLSETLIAFEYPQFDGYMPSLCTHLKSRDTAEKGKALLYADALKRRSRSYSYEKDDRIGAFFDTDISGVPPRYTEEVRSEDEAEEQKLMRCVLCEKFFGLDLSEKSLLKSILGEKKLDALMKRFDVTGEKNRDTDSEIRILGMLYQTVMWAEAENLIIKSSDRSLFQSILSTM